MKISTKKVRFLLAVITSSMLCGCGSIKINLLSDYSEPLKEYTIEGQGDNKILVIPVNGIISGAREEGMVKSKPSVIQEVVAHLQKAKKDKDLDGVILKVNSPGGTTTASDILYNEIIKFKKETGLPVVSCMMDMATSGGYYISLPADKIVAHKTTVTGSVGVVLLRPSFSGLMDKIGVAVNVSKSGTNKDMGSPFRKSTDNEKELFQNLINSLADKFKANVVKHRTISDEALDDIMTAKVYLAEDALEMGLIDKIGYFDDAVAEAKSLASINTARIVIYRRSDFPDDNIYNTSSAMYNTQNKVIDLGFLNPMNSFKTGFYYIWPAAAK